MRRLALLLILLAAAGCAESQPAPAAAPAAAPRRPGAWQQFCEQAWNVQHASSLAGARGADGWELVAMYNGVLCFKRPAAEVRPAPAPAAPASSAPPSFVPAVRDPGF
jgi:hypothetical protein